MSLAFQKKKVNKAELTEIIRGIYEAHGLPVPASFKCKSAASAVVGVVEIDDEDPSAFSWYYHDADAGEYHAIRRQSKPARGYRAALEIDPETGDPRTYSGLLPTKAAALAVLHHLAPEAVELPGLPAWLR